MKNVSISNHYLADRDNVFTIAITVQKTLWTESTINMY